MKLNVTSTRNFIENPPTLIKVSVGFSFSTILIIFFETDLSRILTPFFTPFLFLLIVSIYLTLVIYSFLYLIKEKSWSRLAPLIINLITLVFTIYLFVPLHNLRIDIDFLLKKDRFNQVVQWTNQSIQGGSLILEETKEKAAPLPKQYQNLSDRGQIYVKKEKGTIRIFFSRGGMFESYPGFMYISGNNPPPIEGRDLNCTRFIEPHWYECY